MKLKKIIGRLKLQGLELFFLERRQFDRTSQEETICYKMAIRKIYRKGYPEAS